MCDIPRNAYDEVPWLAIVVTDLVFARVGDELQCGYSARTA